MPYFLGGLKIAGGLSLIGAVVAEFVAGAGGAVVRSRLAHHRGRLPAECAATFCSAVPYFAHGYPDLPGTVSGITPDPEGLARERADLGEVAGRADIGLRAIRDWPVRGMQRGSMKDAIEIPESGWFVLTNARLHRSLTPGLAASFDIDGFALGDIAVADGRITGIAARGDKRRRRARSTSRAASCCRPSSTATPTSTRVTSGRACAIQTGPFAGALDATGTDRLLHWNARDVERPYGFLAALRLRHGTSALRTHLDSVAPQETISWPVFEEMRERWGRADRSAGRLPDGRRGGARDGLVRRARAAGGRCQGGARRRDLHGARSRRFARPGVFDRHRSGAGSRLPRRRDGRRWRHFARPYCRGGAAPGVRGQGAGRPLLLARAAAGQTGAVDPGQGGEGGPRGSVAADVQHVSPGSQERPDDAALARGDAAARDARAGHSSRCRVGQHARPFYAYGDLDMLEVYRMATRILQLDHRSTNGRRLWRRRPPPSCGWRAPACSRLAAAPT